MNGTINRALLLLCLLISISVPVLALNLQPLDENGDRAIDTDTGDIYIWNFEEAHYELDSGSSNHASGNDNFVSVGDDPDSFSDTVDLEVLPSESPDEVPEDFSSGIFADDSIGLLSDYQPDSDSNLGTTNTGIFAGLAYKVPFGQHYVYWRDSQYAYHFAYGDISLENGVFIGNDSVTICSYESLASGYNTHYTWDSWSDSDFSLSVGDSLVYSDLGNYPDLINRRELQHETILSYTAIAAVIWHLFSNLRKAAFGR